MQPIDLTQVLKNAPRGEWLALSFARDRIVAHSPNLSEAHQAALALGEKQPIMMKVPPPHALVL
jgi:hypothetical protein